MEIDSQLQMLLRVFVYAHSPDYHAWPFTFSRAGNQSDKT